MTHIRGIRGRLGVLATAAAALVVTSTFAIHPAAATAAARNTPSPLKVVSVRRARGTPRPARLGCKDAGRWFIWVTPSAAWVDVDLDGCSVAGIDSAARGGWNCPGTGLEPGLE